MATADKQDGSPPVKSQRKFFVPLENNPEVMTSLVHNLGLSSALSFHDVFSIDDPELLAFMPRPAYALLLVFPTNEAYHKARAAEDAAIPVYDGSGPAEKVVWYRQTIGNACGLYGLLHCVSNGAATDFITPGSPLAELLAAAVPLKPTERAELLYNSPALETAHAAAAVRGDTAAPAADADTELHYVCFVKSRADGHLYQLDGARHGPLDRGALPADEDVLGSEALERGVRQFLAREGAAAGGGGDMRFSLVVLAPSME